MSFYRIILVDDEEEIRDGIKRKIDWTGNGFELVGTAENGQEALEMAEALHPDVVMTDIKMPFMDGLTLGRLIYEQMPGIKLVIFSGFDDFEYAQKAIQINVAEYILKPINSAELTAVLQKLKAQLDAEFAEKRDLELLRQHYVSSLPLLREQFLVRLLDGRISQQRIDEQAARYELDLSGNCWTVALAHFDAGSSDSSLMRQSELIPLSIKQLIDEKLGRFSRFKCFIYNDYVAIMAMFDDRSQVLSLIEGLNQICKLARRFLELTLSVGVGSLCDQLTDLRYSTIGAHSALDYRVLLGVGKTIYLDDIEPDPSAQLSFDEQDRRDLISAVKLGKSDNIRCWVDRFIGCSRAVCLPLAQYQLYLLEMMAELLNVIRAYQLDVSEIFGRDFDGNFHLSSFDSLDKFGNWFVEICLKISSLIRRERTNSSKATADKSKQFIEENYANFDISVEMLCDFLHVSPAYFSTLFKKETGMSFVTYLTNVRMEQAIKLLSTTEDKTYEISLKVGYSEPNYFSYVFKKQYGVSPTKYRSSKGEGNG
ncbi:response regulator [Oscillospiraceae bacterium PP1C4]